MAVQSSPVLPQTPKTGVVQYTSAAVVQTVATSTTPQMTTLFTGGANGSKVTSVIASNTSTNALIQAILTVGSTISGAQLFYPVASVTLPSLTSGYDTLLTGQNLFANATLPLPVDGDGNPYLFLASTAYTLSVAISSAPQTNGGRVSIVAIGADF